MSGRLAQGFQVTCVTDLDSWRSIAQDWDRLLRATPAYTGLQSFDFLFTWWQHMAGDRDLWILAFHQGGRLAGIAPLQITRHTTLGKRYRVVEFIGMTEEILLPTMLFPSEQQESLRAALVTHLADHEADWDHLELDELAIDNPLLEDMGEVARRCRRLHRQEPFHDCPFLDLSTETSESYFAKRSRKMLKNLRACERKLGAIGEVTVTTRSSATDILQGFREFVEVEKRSWKRKALIGLADDDRYEPFYQRLLEVFAERHEARTLTLAVGGKPIAATIAILFDGVYCSLHIVHDEEFSRFSPGTLLEYHEMQTLLHSPDIKRYEFLGGALTNKLRWTSDTIQTACVRTRRADLRMRLEDAYRLRAKPLAKRALRSVRALRRSDGE